VPFFLLGKNGTVYYLYYTPHPIHSFLGSFFKEPPRTSEYFARDVDDTPAVNSHLFFGELIYAILL
jgi:hypothetical protein